MIPTTVNVLETCRVSPPPAAVADKTLPLTFFDVIWLTFHPMSRVLFYEFPCSATNFSQTTIPNLKNSLSLALKHFFPLAGNVVTPPDITITNPVIRYSNGDSVSVTFAECTSVKFNHVSRNDARDAEELCPLVPQLPEGSTSNMFGEGTVISPLFAVQVTLFPDQGISIGLTNSHVVGDGSSMFNFVKSWASFAKQIGDDNDLDALTSPEVLPFYDRDVIKDPKGISSIYRKQIGGLIGQYVQQKFEAQHTSASNKKVRETFYMYRADIQALKNLVTTKLPSLSYVSSITVVCAYLWTCLAKTRAAVGDALKTEDEAQHFGIAVDCRARLDPPIPATYFGNCITSANAHGKSKELVGEGGFYKAAELIGEALGNKLNNKEGGVMKDIEKLFDDYGGVITKGEWGMGVAGSPNLDYYSSIDFGFGKPKKFEFVSEPLSLSRCKDSKDGDMEIGLCLPKNQMDVFPTIFAEGMGDLCNKCMEN